MAEIKWIKVTTDMFDNRKIKYLRRLPDGNSIVLIWVMLLTLAGRCNAGGMIFLTENVPYTSKILADELGFDENTVKLALEALERLNMIRSDGFLTIANWEEYQNIEGMERIREQNRLRKQKQREQERLMIDSHVTSRDGHATDIEEDKNKNKNKNKNKSVINATRFIVPTIEEVEQYCKERKNGIDAQRFIDYYTANGWKVGKNPMKDWKAAVRTWEKNGSQSGGKQAKWDYTTHANPVKEEIISFDDWGN